ncbi:MAG: hypothetical protein KF833_20160 [Verrucomicrobiae bacterium]|nr:hypothetical protein [Verrucomicrobiae bacterium]
MKKSITAIHGACALMLAAPLLHAVPTPVGPPLAGSGDGLNSRWVVVDPSIKPDTIAQAEAVLAMGPGDAGFVSQTEAIVPNIAFYDGIGGYSDSGFPMPDPATDPRYAVRYTGFLNIVTGGDYRFFSFTDDGFRFDLGGETISSFDGNRGPDVSVSGLYSLGAGLYPIAFLGWEQGGVFVTELSWSLDGAPESIIPQSAFFSRRPSTGVPDAGSTLVLLMVGVVAGRALLGRFP